MKFTFNPMLIKLSIGAFVVTVMYTSILSALNYMVTQVATLKELFERPPVILGYMIFLSDDNAI